MGNNINGYRIESELGSGGFGTVYMTSKNGQSYAIKKINMAGSDVVKIAREVQILKKLWHQNVVMCFENFPHHNAMWIVMEYCDGGTLNSYLLGLQLPLPQFILLNFVLQITTGVKYLHSQNVIHRDIKPDNIMISSGSQGFTLKIADFGLSREHGNQQYYEFEYSPYFPIFYSAPELLDGHMTFGSDIFSLGCVILSMVSRTTLSGGGGMLVPYISFPSNQTCPLARANDDQKGVHIEHVVKLSSGNVQVEAVLQQLVKDMVRHNWQQRPDANYICTLLNILTNLQPSVSPVQLRFQNGHLQYDRTS